MNRKLQNVLQPAVTLTIGDQTFTLRFDFEAVAEAEEIVDRPLILGLQPKDIQKPTARLVQAMFFACAHCDQPSLTWDAARKLVTRKNIIDVWTTVLQAWTVSNPEPEEEPADPTRARS